MNVIGPNNIWTVETLSVRTVAAPSSPEPPTHPFTRRTVIPAPVHTVFRACPSCTTFTVTRAHVSSGTGLWGGGGNSARSAQTTAAAIYRARITRIYDRKLPERSVLLFGPGPEYFRCGRVKRATGYGRADFIYHSEKNKNNDPFAQVVVVTLKYERGYGALSFSIGSDFRAAANSPCGIDIRVFDA